MTEPPKLPTPAKLETGSADDKQRGNGWAARGASFVFPGFGQFLEKRFAAGAFFLAMCLMGLFMFSVPLVGWFRSYVQLLNQAMDGKDLALEHSPWRYLLGGCVLVLTSWIWSMIDAGRQ